MGSRVNSKPTLIHHLNNSKRPSPGRDLSNRERLAVEILTNPRARINRYCPYCRDGIPHGHNYGGS